MEVERAINKTTILYPEALMSFLFGYDLFPYWGVVIYYPKKNYIRAFGCMGSFMSFHVNLGEGNQTLMQSQAGLSHGSQQRRT